MIHDTQPDLDGLEGGRLGEATTPGSPVATGHVVAVELQTIAAASNYWRQ